MDRPKPGPNASSSDDLERARLLSRRLRGVGAPGIPAAEPGYVSFAPRSAAPPAAAPRATRPTPTPAPPRPSTVPLMTRREPLNAPSAGFGPDGWNKLLDACVVTTGAEAALLMDPHGLIIASRGPAAGDELEVVGARLMVAFEQADRIDGQRSTLSISVELPRGTVHGLRLERPDGALTLGLIVPGGLSAERQARLLTLITAAQ